MNFRSMSKPLAIALALMCCGPSAPAEEVPSWFVAPAQCPSRPCECKDLLMMEKFRDNQITARDAWRSVDQDLRAGTGPTTQQGARDLFRTYFGPGDPDVAAQFRSCPGYDPARNSLNKIAGVGSSGQPLLDPCFCAAFCKDIVDSTILHEKAHVPTIIVFFVGSLPLMARCRLELVPPRLCTVIEPMMLTSTEILSHQAGISSLDSSIEKLRASDPSNPGVPCPTTQSMTKSATPRLPAPAPSSLTERVEILFARIVRGAG